MFNFRYGFTGQKESDYSGTKPSLDVRKHLSGPLISEGMIYGVSGRVISRFVADMHGTWDGAKGHLTEDFRYASGEQQLREWFLNVGNDGRITATAPDIIGDAIGFQDGATTCMRYRLRLPDDAGGHVLNVVDWMYLLENGTILNRSQMRKFGIKVAELIATIRSA